MNEKGAVEEEGGEKKEEGRWRKGVVVAVAV